MAGQCFCRKGFDFYLSTLGAHHEPRLHKPHE
ncbi:hypothetical protein COLO4_09113 [Corchorus olitorius]|uniref:Uncharacterized protein n=1 Tax=Corchorus olitorius TaxID=93759 RepID=A0A1R3KD83_9ROSI|nr:hypothetical protein COLO4_09113 [Corchorus olitorius]